MKKIGLICTTVLICGSLAACGNSSTKSANNDPTQSGDIHSFVNQYGVSPALYKMQHYGMSQQQALDSTPDNMKTSGELQVQHQMDGQ